MRKILFLFSVTVLMISGAKSQLPDEVRLLAYHQRYGSAEQLLHDIIAKEPGNTEAWYQLAQVYLGAGKISAVSDTLNKAPEEVKMQPKFLVALGHLKLLDKDTVAAALLFEQALKDSKMKDPAVLHGIAAAQVDAQYGNASYAITLLEKAVKRDNHNPALYVTMGDAYRKLKDGGGAYKAYQKALDLDPKYAMASYKIGKIYVTQDNPNLFLPHFENAVEADPNYSPALYELYYYYYFKDAGRAMDYLKKYIGATDACLANEFLMTDMLYAQGEYQEAADRAEKLLKTDNAHTARLNKLIAYSKKEMGKNEEALKYMRTYFSLGIDTNYALKDYAAMADMYAAMTGNEDSAALYYGKSADLETDTNKKLSSYKKASVLFKNLKDYKKESYWLGKCYAANPNPSNIDLFNWGIASYLGKDYEGADSLFSKYEEKYPKEEFGYYWSGRSSAAIDTSMSLGKAIPHYKGLIALAASDTAVKISTKHLVEAYGYLAAYEANVQKDYEAAIGYFEKLLEIDPENGDAKRYVAILQKNLSGTKGANDSKPGEKQ